MQTSHDNEEAVMDSEECRDWPEFYVDPNADHSHSKHRTRKERIEVLDVEEEALRKQLSAIQHLGSIVTSLAGEIKFKGPTPIEKEEIKKIIENKDE